MEETTQGAEEIAGSLLGEEQVEETGEETAEAQEEQHEEAEVTPTTEDEEEGTIPKKALIEERRKRQEAEAKLREKEEAEKARQLQSKPESELTIDDWYERDPQGTNERINAEIARLTNDDPYANAQAIERLRDLKGELRDRAAKRFEARQISFVAQVNKVVPDFQAKQKVLTEYAKQELGYDDETLSTFSDPMIVGPDAAIKFVKAVASQYDKAQTAKNLTQKATKPRPTTVETPGQGVRSAPESTKGLLQEARETGDWSRYLDAIGALD